MGILKKIFKPVSKVLDKIIPNEIKPFLPYAAAFAPYMLGPSSGIMGSGMLRRAIMSGALNIGGQLAQEGSEGDINLLSAGLGALQGAMTSPNFGPKIQSLRGLGGYGPDNIASGGIFGGNKYVDKGLEWLGKGSEFMQAPGLKKYAIPATLATGDVMAAEANRDLKDLATDVVDEMGSGYTDDAYRAAIRKSMTAYGATEEEILAAIEAAGYRSGGRVGLELGGIPAARPAQAVEEKETQWITQKPEWKTVKRTLNEIFQEAGGLEGDGMNAVWKYVKDNDLNYDWILQGDEIKVKEKENMGEPVNILDSMDESNTININGIELIMPTKKAKGGRVGFEFGGIGEAVENVNEEMIEEKKDGMLMEIAKVIFRITPVGAGIMAAKDAYDIYESLEDEDKAKVQEFGKKALKMASWTHPAGMAWNLSKAAGNKIGEWNQPQENKMADGGTPSVLPKGIEADYRGGGFIPIGSKERADDVPARLSENEFVMTADAVRAAGGGSVNRGAKRMYDLMHNLEARA